MKKKLAIYFAMLSLLFVGGGCGVGDSDDEILSPYAMMSTFYLNNITSSYPAFTADGRDTIVAKTISGGSFPFSINQQTGDVFNIDSLPYATNVEKLVVGLGVNGYASLYIDSIGIYDIMSISDSLDFSYPRKIRVTAADSKSYKDYTVSVNVHTVEPELMQWNKYEAPEGILFVRALEFDGRMVLFGTKDGQFVVSSTALDGTPAWTQASVLGLPSTANLSTLQSFKDALYAVAADGVYVSLDAVNWSLSYAASGLQTIVGAADECDIWVAGENIGLFKSNDGIVFESMGDLPGGFPLYGISMASYPLSHNNEIIRYMLIGSATADGAPCVWSKLSIEDGWTKYENSNNIYPCPALKGLTVMPYDNSLYAVGGAGTRGDVEVEAFSSFFVSMDNGITWKLPEKLYYHRLPKELVGNNEAFVATVDSCNVMWIINAGGEPSAWKGIINRLGFKE